MRPWPRRRSPFGFVRSTTPNPLPGRRHWLGSYFRFGTRPFSLRREPRFGFVFSTCKPAELRNCRCYGKAARESVGFVFSNVKVRSSGSSLSSQLPDGPRVFDIRLVPVRARGTVLLSGRPCLASSVCPHRQQCAPEGVSGRRRLRFRVLRSHSATLPFPVDASARCSVAFIPSKFSNASSISRFASTVGTHNGSRGGPP